jgi:energy-coupling factor transporter ATP-binding protein EcfA2
VSHVVRFTVSGLAGRSEPYSQTLDRHLNIFFGLNGTGKTSLLKILHSAMSHDSRVLERVPFQSAEVTIYSITYDNEFTKAISRGKLLQSPPAATEGDVSALVETQKRSRFQWIYRQPVPKRARGWQDTYLPTWRLQPAESPMTEYRLHSAFGPEEPDWDLFFAKSLERIWTSYSNELLSQLQRIQGDGLVNILKGIMRPSRSKRKAVQVDVDLAYERVRAFLSRQGARGVIESKESFEKRYRSDRHLRKVVDDINGIEERVEKTRASRTHLEQLIQNMFIGPKRIVFSDTRIAVEEPSGKDIGLAALSSGEKQMLSLLIQSLLAEESSLLIDEPEISLHVDWQRRLVASMQLLNREAQYILATHSPEIMADISDKNIFRL